MVPDHQFLTQEIFRARRLTDALFATVHSAALYERPIPERCPILFYVGHLEAFDWNLAGRCGLGLGPVVEELDSLFAFGIDPPQGQQPRNEPSVLPKVEDVKRYVGSVRTQLDRLRPLLPERVLRMALEHRLMHAETLTYLIHNLPESERLMRKPATYPPNESPPFQFVRIPKGVARLGTSAEADFRWDNEGDAHSVEVESFAISRHKVTNGQYLSFVREGGPRPHYWTERDGLWSYRSFTGDVPLPLDVPVYVTHQQAEAFARWRGKALPTEAQFDRAAFASGIDERRFPWGDTPPQTAPGNFGFRVGDLTAVNASPEDDSGFGLSQMVGNGWEWTSTVFAPFPGFSPDPLYPGYSSDFFDGDHYVVKGASCATDYLLIRRGFRNWFRDHYPFAYTTFRLVEN